MIKKVARYKTKDGEIFESKTKAEEYIVNHYCEYLSDIIMKLGTVGIRDRIAIVEAIVGDIDKIRTLKTELDRLVSTGDRRAPR